MLLDQYTRYQLGLTVAFDTEPEQSHVHPTVGEQLGLHEGESGVSCFPETSQRHTPGLVTLDGGFHVGL